MATNTTQTIGGGPSIPPATISEEDVMYIIVTSVLQALSTIAVVLRFFSRRLAKATSWDDWASLTALIFSYGNTVGVLICAIPGKGGFHLASFTLVQLGEFLKGVLIFNVTMVLSTAFSKLAILWFYRRLFLNRTMKILIWIFVFLVLGPYLLVGLCLLIFANDPIDSQWKPWIHPRRSLGTTSVYEYIVVADMVNDIGILCLPQVLVWRLQVPLRRRLLISMLFLLGAFTCALTALRLDYLVKLDADFTFHVVRAGLWGTIELHLSVIIGCAPMFPKLFRYSFASQSVSTPNCGRKDSSLSLPSSLWGRKSTSASEESAKYSVITNQVQEIRSWC